MSYNLSQFYISKQDPTVFYFDYQHLKAIKHSIQIQQTLSQYLYGEYLVSQQTNKPEYEKIYINHFHFQKPLNYQLCFSNKGKIEIISHNKHLQPSQQNQLEQFLKEGTYKTQYCQIEKQHIEQLCIIGLFFYKLVKLYF